MAWKRLRAGVLAPGTAVGTVGVAASPAPAAVAATNCGEEGTVVSANYIRIRASGREIGTVQLCKERDILHFTWVRLYEDLGTGRRANGFLRIHNPAGTQTPGPVDTCKAWSGEITGRDRECRTVAAAYAPGGGRHRADAYVCR